MLLLASTANALPVQLTIGFDAEPEVRLSVDAPASHGSMILAFPRGDRDLVWLDLAVSTEPDGQIVYEPHLTWTDPRRRVPARAVFARPRVTAAPGQLAELSSGTPGREGFRMTMVAGQPAP